MSGDPETRRAEGEARAAEIKRDVEGAEARSAEEDQARAEKAAADATKAAEEEARTAERERLQATRAREDAEAARARADQAGAGRGGDGDSGASTVSGARVTSPGIGAESPPRAAAAASAGSTAAGSTAAGSTAAPAAGPTSLTERPEVLVGAAFAGSFLLAKILQRLVAD